MTMRANSNTFVKYLIRRDTVEGPFYQTLGDTIVTNWEINTQTTFSPNGKHFARVNACNGVMLYDFDRETGLLSNYRNIGKGCAMLNDSLKLVGVAFSPNSRYLYISGWMFLFKADMEAPDVAQSLEKIADYDGFSSGPNQFTVFGLLQLGPDCRIYGSSQKAGRYLHVIHQPDLPGKMCDLRQHDLRMPSRRSASMPLFPSYRLGTDQPICDPGIVAPVVSPFFACSVEVASLGVTVTCKWAFSDRVRWFFWKKKISNCCL